jgi:hypothetical protein
MKYKASFIYYGDAMQSKSLESKHIIINLDEVTEYHGVLIPNTNLRAFKSGDYIGFIGIYSKDSDSIILYLRRII